MAKRKKLYGAALAAHQKKARRGGSKRKHKNRVRHTVKRHSRKGGGVKAYRRKGSQVKQHMSNPYYKRSRRGRRSHRNPAFGGVAMEGLMAAGVLFGTLFVVGFANKQASKFGPLSSGWGNLAGKLAIALGGSYAAIWAARRGYLSSANSKVAAAAAWSPLALGLVATFAPQVAGQISLADEDDGGSDMGRMTSEGDVAAELQAALNAELQSSERDSVESGTY